MCEVKNRKNGPVGFWCLNDWIDYNVVESQLIEFADKGFSGVVIHPRDGLKIPFLSRSWFDLIEYIIELSGKLSLQVWFYDEDPYPSGSAGGKLLEFYPNLVGRTLEFTEIDVEPVNGLVYKKFSGLKNVIRVYAFEYDSEYKISDNFKDITEYTGLIGDKWHVMGVCNQNYGPIFENRKSAPHWRAVVQGENCTLHWPTKDNIKRKLLIVSTKERADTRHGSYVDLLNPETTQRFLELTHKSTYDAIGKEKFSQFVACFTDEVRLCYPFPWTDKFPEVYFNEYKRSFFKDLPHIYMAINYYGYRVRYDYRTLLAKLWKKNHFEVVSKWCKKHDIKYTGHLAPEEDPLCQATSAPDVAEMLCEMDWPGTDTISSLIGTPDYNCKLFGQKLVSSLANQFSKERVLSECLGVSGDGLTIDRMKKTIDWLAICGIDTYVFHGQFYSLRGDRKREAPPSIFYQAPYWKYFKEISDYISNISEILRKGKTNKPIAVLYPTSTFKAMPPICQELMHKADKEDLGVVKKYMNLIGRLMSSALDFDILNETFLDKIEVVDEKLKVGDVKYDCLIVPDVEFIDESTMRILDKLSNSGLKIVSLKKEIRSIQDLDCLLEFNTVTIDNLIDNLIKRYSDIVIESDSSHIYVNTLITEDGMQKILWNPTDKVAKISLDNSFQISRLDSSIIDIKECIQSGRLYVNLDPWQTILVENRKRSKIKIDKICCFNNKSQNLVKGPYLLEPLDSNQLNLAHWRVKSENGKDELIEVPSATGQQPWLYSCKPALAETQIVIEDKIIELMVVFERTSITDQYTFMINGNEIAKSEYFIDGYNFCFDVKQYIKLGVNDFTIKINKSPANKPVISDPIKLKGDFIIKEIFDPDSMTKNIIASRPNKIILSSNLSWADNGFPHYSGIMKYKTKFEFNPLDSQKYFIGLYPQENDVSEIILNSKTIGVIAWRNAKLEITDHIEKGHNNLEILVANTIINSVESIKQPSGLRGFPSIIVCDTQNKGNFEKMNFLNSSEKTQASKLTLGNFAR